MYIHKIILNFLICLSILLTTVNIVDAYDWTKHAGELYAINVPEKAPREKLSLSEAQGIVVKYRWIYVNSSLQDLNEAKEQATKLSNAVGRPLVLVYMPRHVGDGQRNDYHPQFQTSLAGLIERAIADGKELLISAKSYGVHQALRVMRRFDSPLILLTGIAPAFGAFGNQWSANVKQYVKDVEQTRCKYCMIASEDDGFTWRSGGAAYKKRIGFRGDNDVGRAMQKNRKNVHIIVLHGADHAPIDEYLNHGLVKAMRQAADHFGMKNTPVGDVVYGRKIAPVAEATSSQERSVRFFLHFPDAYLVHEPDNKRLQIVAEGAALSYGANWEIKKMKDYLYHLRQNIWKDFYWKVNTSRKQVYKVTGGSFGKLGGQEKILRIKVDVVGSVNNPERFLLRFPDAYLVHNPGNKVLQIIAERSVLSYGKDWDVKKMKDYLFHLRQKMWKDFYWKVNTSRKKVYKVRSGTFVQLGGQEQVLNIKVELKP